MSQTDIGTRCEMAGDDQIRDAVDRIYAQMSAVVKERVHGHHRGGRLDNPRTSSSWREPSAIEAVGVRDDGGSGFQTLTMRLGELWRDQGESALLDLIPELERLELLLRDGSARRDEGLPDYTYTLY